MPLLGALLLGVFASLVDFFVTFFTREVALRIAFGVLMVGGLTVLSVAIASAAALITASLPSDLASVFLFVFPGNVNACLGVVIATEGACAGYRAYLLGFGR